MRRVDITQFLHENSYLKWMNVKLPCQREVHEVKDPTEGPSQDNFAYIVGHHNGMVADSAVSKTEGYWQGDVPQWATSKLSGGSRDLR